MSVPVPIPASPSIPLASPQVVLPQRAYGEEPCRLTCPYCRRDIVTVVRATPGFMTYAACFVMLLFGCVLGCCLIPFCIQSCQDVYHRCPSCNAIVGHSTRTLLHS